VLGLGANDMLRGIAPEITKTNLSKIIDTVLDKDIKLLLTGMKSPNSYGSDYQQSFNDIYPNLAEEFKISFYPFLLEGVALIPELNQSDGKHPNREGIQIISKNLANTITSIIN
jgi:acyl-CoA thioesterase-1